MGIALAQTPPFAVWIIALILILAVVAFFAQLLGEAGARMQQARSFPSQAVATSEPPQTIDTQTHAPAQQEAPTSETFITVKELAAADNLLIVGNRGSGKTTLLAAILRHRPPARYIFDPHNEPGKWDGAARVVGGGRDFQAVYAALQAAERTMDARSKELAQDAAAKARFVPFSVISDEWGSVNEEITFDAREQDAPGKLVRLLLKEGRKFKISFIASAHGDTNASLGCTGDKKAFENSFDWFIYMGAFVAEKVPADVMKRIPLGKNPEGGTFPLIVVAYSPTTRETRLLDLRGLADDATTPRLSPTPLDLEQRLDTTRDETSATDWRNEARELAQTTRLSSNEIFRRVGGNRNEVLDIVRDERGNVSHFA